MGNRFDLATFEVNFSEDLYFVENWAVPCVQKNSTCKSRVLTTRSVSPPANATFTTLQNGTWVQVPLQTSTYYEFDINCPHVVSITRDLPEFPPSPPSLRNRRNVLLVGCTIREISECPLSPRLIMTIIILY